MRTLYEAEATATGDGRNGHARTSDGVVDIDLEMPAAMGGKGAAGTVAEELAEAAHQLCPYSHATRGNIDVALEPE